MKPNVIDGKEWKLVVTRNMSYWHNIPSILGHEFNTIDYGVGIPCRWLFITLQSTETHVFMESENLAAYTQAVRDAFGSKEKVELMKARYVEYADELLKTVEELNQSITPARWGLFLDAYQRMCAGLMVTTSFGRSGTELLIQKLKEKGINEDEIANIVGLVTYPAEHTPLFDSQLSMMQIGAQVQNGGLKGDKLEDALQTWLGRYGSIPVNFCEEPWQMKDAKAQFDGFLAKNCTEELVKAEEGHVKRIEDGQKMLEKINDNEISTIAFALAEATYINEFRKNVFCRVSLGYRKAFAEVAKLADSKDWRDCFYLTPKEMTNLIEGGQVDLDKIKKERRVAGMYIKDGELVDLDREVLDGLEKLIKELHGSAKAASTLEKSTNTLKGFSASRGKATGIARIILSSKDFNRLAPGEILVTTMTSVDFVPVMERAGAFVTNEGGITSHASIVAREMGKPCIIGTKTGTQVIKDGDMVEVDAEKGIVTILSQ